MLMSRSSVGEIAENLILARLLVPGSRPPARADVQKSLAPLFTERLSPAEWRTLFDAALEELIVRDLVAPKPLVHTLMRYEISLPVRYGVDGVCAISDEFADRLAARGYPREKICPIYYGYDAQAFPF